ncbi:hypothetical protein GRS66_008886 [Saccharomyces pastorianus]|uniref:Uncharacterized protein n=1 Tax=Saccharomyces pastorianus TaxID=27292 RepID=A0A6C1EAA4_SACPS|nr:hypothetical protein GRS66_008886 [Saccharomyces pastorianus]
MPFAELYIEDDFLEELNKNPGYKVWLLVDRNKAGYLVYPATIYLSHITDGFAKFFNDVKRQYNEKGFNMDDIYRHCGACIINKHPLMKSTRDRR